MGARDVGFVFTVVVVLSCANAFVAVKPVMLRHKAVSWCHDPHFSLRAPRSKVFSAMAQSNLESAQASAPPSLSLSYVDDRDVKRLQQLLTSNGASNVRVEDAEYGEKVLANIPVESVLRTLGDIAALVKPSGQFTLEGIAQSEVESVKAAFSAFFEEVKVAENDNNKALLTGWRKDPWMVAGFSSLPLARERERTKTDSKFW
eukprot:CAMPEP_0202809626 /NCGR_PEP_ID=MMETSP1389-20130828/1912_1 /ASSEMBLY_ACC=CAM_ASM_000865 /TAXON_ID=302021 /ORGANISM="Rhodomonas sp., Strain CCMP768" /LENGTH=202 /DNA_ID=CAMNT_0049480299 /DNA_START=10 /DNA_END=615 /DNA_ORIENTATION=-